MFCSNCGNEVNSTNNFCTNCGNKAAIESTSTSKGSLNMHLSSGDILTQILRASKITKRKIIVSVVVVAAALIASVGFFLLTRKDERLANAMKSCSAELFFVLSEDHKSISFDDRGQDEIAGGDFLDLKCVINALNAPSTIWERMTTTTALMGSQDGDWDGIKVTWTYHPDNGLDCYISLT